MWPSTLRVNSGVRRTVGRRIRDDLPLGTDLIDEEIVMSKKNDQQTEAPQASTTALSTKERRIVVTMSIVFVVLAGTGIALFGLNGHTIVAVALAGLFVLATVIVLLLFKVVQYGNVLIELFRNQSR